MLVWMAVGPARAILEGLQRCIVALAPAIDILSVRVVAYSGFTYSIFISVVQKGADTGLSVLSYS